MLRQDRDLRGKTAEEIKALMERGLRLDKADLPITYIENEMDAIDHVLATAPEGAVITLFTENISAVLAKLDKYEATVATE